MDRSSITYRAYRKGKKQSWIQAIATAIGLYEERVGERPRLLLLHPINLTKELEDKFGDWIVPHHYVLKNEFWLTHEATSTEFPVLEFVPYAPSTNNDKAEEDAKGNVSSSHRDAPHQGDKKVRSAPPYCPVCNRVVVDFEALGYWPGWEFGITPPYWEALRLYVFRRDRYVCKICEAKYPVRELNAHHIKPKEEGGVDSAKNLATICGNCHLDGKPVFEDTEEEKCLNY